MLDEGGDADVTVWAGSGSSPYRRGSTGSDSSARTANTDWWTFQSGSLVIVTPLGEELRDMRTSFLSQLAVERFLGYMHSQHERMLGQSKRNVPNRPELIEAYGWDVKYGSHALRLAHQGFEIASTGNLTLPMPDRERERVLAVKRGEVDRDEVSAEISRLELQVRSLLDEGGSPLPRTADLDRISAWAIGAERRHWQWS